MSRLYNALERARGSVPQTQDSVGIPGAGHDPWAVTAKTPSAASIPPIPSPTVAAPNVLQRSRPVQGRREMPCLRANS